MLFFALGWRGPHIIPGALALCQIQGCLKAARIQDVPALVLAAHGQWEAQQSLEKGKTGEAEQGARVSCCAVIVTAPCGEQPGLPGQRPGSTRGPGQEPSGFPCSGGETAPEGTSWGTGRLTGLGPPPPQPPCSWLMNSQRKEMGNCGLRGREAGFKSHDSTTYPAEWGHFKPSLFECPLAGTLSDGTCKADTWSERATSQESWRGWRDLLGRPEASVWIIVWRERGGGRLAWCPGPGARHQGAPPARPSAAAGGQAGPERNRPRFRGDFLVTEERSDGGSWGAAGLANKVLENTGETRLPQAGETGGLFFDVREIFPPLHFFRVTGEDTGLALLFVAWPPLTLDSLASRQEGGASSSSSLCPRSGDSSFWLESEGARVGAGGGLSKAQLSPCPSALVPARQPSICTDPWPVCLTPSLALFLPFVSSVGTGDPASPEATTPRSVGCPESTVPGCGPHPDGSMAAVGNGSSRRVCVPGGRKEKSAREDQLSRTRPFLAGGAPGKMAGRYMVGRNELRSALKDCPVFEGASAWAGAARDGSRTEGLRPTLRAAALHVGREHGLFDGELVREVAPCCSHSTSPQPLLQEQWRLTPNECFCGLCLRGLQEEESRGFCFTVQHPKHAERAPAFRLLRSDSESSFFTCAGTAFPAGALVFASRNLYSCGLRGVPARRICGAEALRALGSGEPDLSGLPWSWSLRLGVLRGCQSGSTKLCRTGPGLTPFSSPVVPVRRVTGGPRTCSGWQQQLCPAGSSSSAGGPQLPVKPASTTMCRQSAPVPQALAKLLLRATRRMVPRDTGVTRILASAPSGWVPGPSTDDVIQGEGSRWELGRGFEPYHMRITHIWISVVGVQAGRACEAGGGGGWEQVVQTVPDVSLVLSSRTLTSADGWPESRRRSASHLSLLVHSFAAQPPPVAPGGGGGGFHVRELLAGEVESAHRCPLRPGGWDVGCEGAVMVHPVDGQPEPRSFPHQPCQEISSEALNLTRAWGTNCAVSMKCAWLGMQGFLVEAVPGPLPVEGGRLLLHKEGRPRGRGHMFHCCLTMIFPQQLLTVSPRLTILWVDEPSGSPCDGRKWGSLVPTPSPGFLTFAVPEESLTQKEKFRPTPISLCPDSPLLSHGEGGRLTPRRRRSHGETSRNEWQRGEAKNQGCAESEQPAFQVGAGRRLPRRVGNEEVRTALCWNILAQLARSHQACVTAALSAHSGKSERHGCASPPDPRRCPAAAAGGTRLRGCRPLARRGWGDSRPPGRTWAACHICCFPGGVLNSSAAGRPLLCVTQVSLLLICSLLSSPSPASVPASLPCSFAARIAHALTRGGAQSAISGAKWLDALQHPSQLRGGRRKPPGRQRPKEKAILMVEGGTPFLVQPGAGSCLASAVDQGGKDRQDGRQLALLSLMHLELSSLEGGHNVDGGFSGRFFRSDSLRLAQLTTQEMCSLASSSRGRWRTAQRTESWEGCREKVVGRVFPPPGLGLQPGEEAPRPPPSDNGFPYCLQKTVRRGRSRGPQGLLVLVLDGQSGWRYWFPSRTLHDFVAMTHSVSGYSFLSRIPRITPVPHGTCVCADGPDDRAGAWLWFCLGLVWGGVESRLLTCRKLAPRLGFTAQRPPDLLSCWVRLRVRGCPLSGGGGGGCHVKFGKGSSIQVRSSRVGCGALGIEAFLSNAALRSNLQTEEREREADRSHPRAFRPAAPALPEQRGGGKRRWGRAVSLPPDNQANWVRSPARDGSRGRVGHSQRGFLQASRRNCSPRCREQKLRCAELLGIQERMDTSPSGGPGTDGLTAIGHRATLGNGRVLGLPRAQIPPEPGEEARAGGRADVGPRRACVNRGSEQGRELVEELEQILGVLEHSTCEGEPAKCHQSRLVSLGRSLLQAASASSFSRFYPTPSNTLPSTHLSTSPPPRPPGSPPPHSDPHLQQHFHLSQVPRGPTSPWRFLSFGGLQPPDARGLGGAEGRQSVFPAPLRSHRLLRKRLCLGEARAERVSAGCPELSWGRPESGWMGLCPLKKQLSGECWGSTYVRTTLVCWSPERGERAQALKTWRRRRVQTLPPPPVSSRASLWVLVSSCMSLTCGLRAREVNSGCSVPEPGGCDPGSRCPPLCSPGVVSKEREERSRDKLAPARGPTLPARRGRDDSQVSLLLTRAVPSSEMDLRVSGPPSPCPTVRLHAHWRSQASAASCVDHDRRHRAGRRSRPRPGGASGSRPEQMPPWSLRWVGRGRSEGCCGGSFQDGRQVGSLGDSPEVLADPGRGPGATTARRAAAGGLPPRSAAGWVLRGAAWLWPGCAIRSQKLCTSEPPTASSLLRGSLSNTPPRLLHRRPRLASAALCVSPAPLRHPPNCLSFTSHLKTIPELRRAETTGTVRNTPAPDPIVMPASAPRALPPRLLPLQPPCQCGLLALLPGCSGAWLLSASGRACSAEASPVPSDLTSQPHRPVCLLPPPGELSSLGFRDTENLCPTFLLTSLGRGGAGLSFDTSVLSKRAPSHLISPLPLNTSDSLTPSFSSPILFVSLQTGQTIQARPLNCILDVVTSRSLSRTLPGLFTLLCCLGVPGYTCHQQPPSCHFQEPGQQKLPSTTKFRGFLAPKTRRSDGACLQVPEGLPCGGAATLAWSHSRGQVRRREILASVKKGAASWDWLPCEAVRSPSPAGFKQRSKEAPLSSTPAVSSPGVDICAALGSRGRFGGTVVAFRTKDPPFSLETCKGTDSTYYPRRFLRVSGGKEAKLPKPSRENVYLPLGGAQEAHCMMRWRGSRILRRKETEGQPAKPRKDAFCPLLPGLTPVYFYSPVSHDCPTGNSRRIQTTVAKRSSRWTCQGWAGGAPALKRGFGCTGSIKLTPRRGREGQGSTVQSEVREGVSEARDGVSLKQPCNQMTFQRGIRLERTEEGYVCSCCRWGQHLHSSHQEGSDLRGLAVLCNKGRRDSGRGALPCERPSLELHTVGSGRWMLRSETLVTCGLAIRLSLDPSRTSSQAEQDAGSETLVALTAHFTLLGRVCQWLAQPWRHGGSDLNANLSSPQCEGPGDGQVLVWMVGPSEWMVGQSTMARRLGTGAGFRERGPPVSSYVDEDGNRKPSASVRQMHWAYGNWAFWALETHPLPVLTAPPDASWAGLSQLNGQADTRG
ncbi:hypothetical protein Cadr_000028708 [Camelus dromedarius]|uniref:Uncharacterized protein n=1 Tax=Camelus dromedarius TaxID=9838 RepID=A0A5N4C7S9_CAMDR|nr:hypothetical protein Cadr_000028708 [Camelus dromedarius]